MNTELTEPHLPHLWASEVMTKTADGAAVQGSGLYSSEKNKPVRAVFPDFLCTCVYTRPV